MFSPRYSPAREILRDLVFTPQCLGCQRLGQHVCSQCRNHLTSGARTLTASYGPLNVGFVGSYSGWLRTAVLGYKSGQQINRFGLAKLLSSLTPSGVIVPIPTSPQKLKQRGFDSILEITKVLVRTNSDLRLARGTLKYRRKVVDQIGLSAAKRADNLANAFVALGEFPRQVILIDDVVTTGATLLNSAHALHLAGVENISALALCATSNFGLPYAYGSHPGP